LGWPLKGHGASKPSGRVATHLEGRRRPCTRGMWPSRSSCAGAGPRAGRVSWNAGTACSWPTSGHIADASGTGCNARQCRAAWGPKAKWSGGPSSGSSSGRVATSAPRCHATDGSTTCSSRSFARDCLGLPTRPGRQRDWQRRRNNQGSAGKFWLFHPD